MNQSGRIASLLLILAALLGSPAAKAAGKTTYSLQIQALAPNAGGQRAYALRRATDNSEWAVFANDYLRAEDYPLMGGLYSLRFPVCGHSCFWQFYVQTGVGISNVGPLIELLWGTNLLWSLRLDVATQIFFSLDRAIFWSYPLWIGVSIAL